MQATDSMRVLHVRVLMYAFASPMPYTFKACLPYFCGCWCAYTGPLDKTEEGFLYVCTFVDFFTKFAEFFPLKDKSASGVAKCIRSFVNRYIIRI